MNFKFHLTTFQEWSIVVKIALNALYRDDVDSVFFLSDTVPDGEINRNHKK